MASQLINLDQLRTAITRTRSYMDGSFAPKVHDHNTLYYTQAQIDNFFGNVDTKLAAKADTNHTQASDSIIRMTGYAKADTASAIATTDSLNVAIGKLEKAVEDAANSIPNFDGVYLKVNDTAVAAKKLETARSITLSGVITGSTSFDGTGDVTISTAITGIASDKVTAMTGYIKPDDNSPITSADTLNLAIGKLEKMLDGKQAAGDYAPAEHNHNVLYYTKEEITQMLADISGEGSVELAEAKAYTDSAIAKITGDGVSEALDTLKELGDALNNDPNFAGSITTNLAGKADKKHTHDVATTDTDGFMSAADKTKLNGIQARANNYVHPTGAGYNHIPTGGSLGQILRYAANGTAEWATITTTDQYVKNTLDTVSRAYITGTTSNTTNTGDQIFDTGVYLTKNAGELAASKFVGDLDGTASNATVAESCTGNAATASLAERTRQALGISINGVSQGTFDGSTAINIDITPASIGAPTMTQFTEATTQATTQEVTNMLDEVFVVE